MTTDDTLRSDLATVLHDIYGCRVTCRGGRLADDRHPSHTEAYLDTADRVIASVPSLALIAAGVTLAAPAEGLDVERLARAINVAGHGGQPEKWQHLDWGFEWYGTPREMAEAIAREYAALDGEPR